MLSSSQVHFRKRSRRFNIFCANTTCGVRIAHERFIFEYLNKQHVFFFRRSKLIEFQNVKIHLNFNVDNNIETK